MLARRILFNSIIEVVGTVAYGIKKKIRTISYVSVVRC